MSSSPEQFRPETRKSLTKEAKEEGVKLYKNAVREFLIQCGKIDRERRKWWKENKKELYLGSVNWSTEDYAWEKEKKEELFLLAEGLGLTEVENDAIWEAVKQGR